MLYNCWRKTLLIIQWSICFMWFDYFFHRTATILSSSSTWLLFTICLKARGLRNGHVNSSSNPEGSYLNFTFALMSMGKGTNPPFTPSTMIGMGSLALMWQSAEKKKVSGFKPPVSPVGLGCRIRRPPLCKGVIPPSNECLWYDTKLHLIVKLQLSSFGSV